MDTHPFHAGELEAQARAGVSSRGAGIRDFMPDQHRDFFALLPYLFAAGRDAEGWPIATMLTGERRLRAEPDGDRPAYRRPAIARRSGRRGV